MVHIKIIYEIGFIPKPGTVAVTGWDCDHWDLRPPSAIGRSPLTMGFSLMGSGITSLSVLDSLWTETQAPILYHNRAQKPLCFSTRHKQSCKRERESFWRALCLKGEENLGKQIGGERGNWKGSYCAKKEKVGSKTISNCSSFVSYWVWNGK